MSGMVLSGEETKTPKTSVSFGITNMPVGVWKRFKEYSERSAGDCYWMAIDKLLQNDATDFRYEALFEMIVDTKRQLDELRKELEGESDVPEEIATLGRKG